MAQPTPYVRQYNFTDYQTEHPSDPLPGSQVDIEYNTVKQTLDQILANLELIQRDDGALANQSVGVDQMKAEVNFGLNAVTDWEVGVVYQPNNGVWFEGKLYRCLEAHTSTVFATDLAAERWSLLLDIVAPSQEVIDEIVAATVQPLVDDAEAARDAALAAQQAAEDARDASIVAQGLSEDARDASVTAQGLSEDARDASVTAQGLSEDARDASVVAQGLSEDARDAAAVSAAAAAALLAGVVWRDVVYKTFADSPITLVNADSGKLFIFDTSGGNIVVNLATIAGITMPASLGFQKTTSDANTVTINRGGTDTIGTAGTSKVLSTQNQGCTLIGDTDPSPDRWAVLDYGLPVGIPMATAGGSANAMTAAFTPPFPSYTGAAFIVTQTSGNTITAPTMDVDGLGAVTIVKNNNQALVTNDTLGTKLYVYNAAISRLVIMNPTKMVIGDLNSQSASSGQAPLSNGSGAITWQTIPLLSTSNTWVNPQTFSSAINLTAGQIAFPATQVASADANTLDDYEEGTYTPAVAGTSTAGSGTYVVQAGSYIKVGKGVNFTHHTAWNAHTGTGNIKGTGLPFTSENVSQSYWACSILPLNLALTATHFCTAHILSNTTDISLISYPSGGGAGANVAMDTNAELEISGFYIASA